MERDHLQQQLFTDICRINLTLWQGTFFFPHFNFYMGSTFYGFSSTSRTAGISTFFPHLATYLAKKWTNHQNGMGFRKLKAAEAPRVAGSLPFSSPATASQGPFRQIELPLLNPSGMQHLRYQLQRPLQNTVTARNYSPSNLNFVMAS